MIRIQRLIGCRPGELCRMRWDEISRHPGADGNRSSRWHWRPSKHKTKHRGKGKLYVIGPRAQHMLEMWGTGRTAARLPVGSPFFVYQVFACSR
ncbi:MAG: hypothetical protein MUE50_19720 [Pirellulaceae bacterium]|jgi:integrase|nr:hypothetical protein [Pirellulaceae bacterium]